MSSVKTWINSKTHRWATAEETEEHLNSKPHPGALWVERMEDSTGCSYPEPVCDLAVPRSGL